MKFDMSVESIMEYWTSHAEPPELSLARWNKSADGYAKMELPTEADSLAMRIMRDKGIFDMGGSCLDVGCGAGRFSFAMEQRGFSVTGTDFAPKMIEQCEKKKAELNSKVNFVQADWHHVDLARMGWEKSFDFVLCHMSPAICDAETFMKLSRAAKHAVLMLRPSRWVYTLERELMRELNIAPRVNEVDKAMAYAFDLVWLQSGSPETAFEEHTWQSRLPADEAGDEYIRRLEKYRALSDAEKDFVRKFVQDRAENGEVDDSVKTEIFSMFYRVDGVDYYS